MIKTPTLLIDEQKCKSNIKMMYDKASNHHVELRPHFKTHQSLEIGRWFKDVGVKKITVSSLKMARYFSDEWDDILVAFPTNINEIDAINELAHKTRLHLNVENLESITFLAKHLNSSVSIYIQVDAGYHRTGIDPSNVKLINQILRVIDDSDRLSFVGFYAHSGHTYQCRNAEDIKGVHTSTLQIMSGLAKHFPFAKIALGDTPSCSVAEDFSGIDEVCPGNFVFYDLMQHQIGSCDISQIAVAMACPIVAIHKDRSELVIYGGGVHFSKERLEDVEATVYGRVAEKTKSGWGNLIPDMYIRALSQEHGIVSAPLDLIDHYQIGDHLLILPVHSCMTANLMGGYNTLDGKVISMS
jgi:D-serine deaminase-like pyridoxal phosphate-dependent protein